MLLTKATSDYELITTWLLNKPSPSTRKQYQTNIKQFMSFIGGPLSEVKIEDLQGYVRMLEMKGNKTSTIKGKLSVVKSLFSFAFSVGYITSNVAVLVKSPKVHKRTASMRINHDDIRKMVDGASSDRDRLMIKMMYFLGLRVSEVLRLTWNDFYQDGGNVKVFITGKGNRERSLIVPNQLWTELLTIKTEYNQTFVFTAYQRDEMLKRQAVNMMLNRLKERLGIDSNIHPHKFRHEHSMTSLDNGCDIHLLSRSLGHSSVSITESYYLNGREKQSSSTYINL
jgi:integrase/recombinase XerD